MEAEAAERVKGLNLAGLGFVKESQRCYPQEYLAAQLLGYVGMDNTGLAGLELQYERDLAGRPGRGGDGETRPHPFYRLQPQPPRPGYQGPLRPDLPHPGVFSPGPGPDPGGAGHGHHRHHRVHGAGDAGGGRGPLAAPDGHRPGGPGQGRWSPCPTLPTAPTASSPSSTPGATRRAAASTSSSPCWPWARATSTGWGWA